MYTSIYVIYNWLVIEDCSKNRQLILNLNIHDCIKASLKCGVWIGERNIIFIVVLH